MSSMFIRVNCTASAGSGSAVQTGAKWWPVAARIAATRGASALR
jgi:hypothetical protein